MLCAGRLFGFAERPVRYHGALVSRWKASFSAAFGMFIFHGGNRLPKEARAKILVHEYGHTRQSLLLGPLYLPAIAIPSGLWAFFPGMERYRRRRGVSYYRFYCERWANRLGEKTLGERSPGTGDE